jgi:hypothetical protein
MHPGRDMDVTKNCKKKCAFLMIVPGEKFEYLKNGTLFFEAVCVGIHQTLAPITCIKMSEIDHHRLSRFYGSR